MVDNKFLIVVVYVFDAILRVSIYVYIYVYYSRIFFRLQRYFSQASIKSVQHSNGSVYVRNSPVEFRSCWNDLYTLARPFAVATSVSYLYLCFNGPCFHQIPTGMDGVGCPGCYQYLG